jgi:tetratricopeptide (TPR) repeat protein
MVNLSTYLSNLRSRFVSVNLDRPMAMQIFSEMIGEVRTVLASYILITADMYHHERGDKIDWRRDPATLPLHRLVTALDPHIEQSYDFGAYQLAVNMKKTREAIGFLQEGLRYNPKSYQLNFTMGDIYYIKKDFGVAEKYYLRAYKLTDTLIEKANVIRRMYWCERYLKNYAQARVYLNLLKQISPDFAVYARFEKELNDLEQGVKTEEQIKSENKKKPGQTDKHNKNNDVDDVEHHKHDHDSGHKH